MKDTDTDKMVEAAVREMAWNLCLAATAAVGKSISENVEKEVERALLEVAPGVIEAMGHTREEAAQKGMRDAAWGLRLAVESALHDALEEWEAEWKEPETEQDAAAAARILAAMSEAIDEELARQP